MVKRLALFVVWLGASTCSVYAPTFKDCAVHCSETDTCPAGTTCSETFCRPAGFSGSCDCAVGASEACGGGRGECKVGLRICLESRIWGPCLGDVKPSAETCDGKDNNCDGTVDNLVVNAPFCPLTEGVCARVTQPCLDGGFVNTCGPAAYGPHYEVIEQTCDGLDNDCDGTVDSRAPARIAMNVGMWTVARVPGGYFLFTADPGTRLISAQQFDDTLKAVATAASIDVGVVVAGFEQEGSTDGTVAVGFRGADDSVGVVRVTTTAPAPVLLNRVATSAPTDWSLSVLQGGTVRAAVAQADGGLVLGAWNPGSLLVSVARHVPRFPANTVSGVTLTNDGTVLAWDGEYDPMDGGTSGSVGGIEQLDGGRAVGNGNFSYYRLVPTPGRLQGFRTFSNYIPIFPISIDESGALYCADVWLTGATCTVTERVPAQGYIRSGRSTRLGNEMAVGWLNQGVLNVGTALPSVDQVRSRTVQTGGTVADFALAADENSGLLGVFYRPQADATSIYGVLLCPP